MNRPGHEDVQFFTGVEVEHTPAHGQPTLFVIGLLTEEAIKAALANFPKINHIYFGANQSFPNPDVNDGDTWRPWESMIETFLSKGYLCTLDIDVKSAEGLIEGSLVDYNNFIPMISVKLPYIQLYGYNATIKLDDRDFAMSNPGVWCHSLHDLRDRKKFTDWSQYTKDETVK
jgi:hypothetical protein